MLMDFMSEGARGASQTAFSVQKREHPRHAARGQHARSKQHRSECHSCSCCNWLGPVGMQCNVNTCVKASLVIAKQRERGGRRGDCAGGWVPGCLSTEDHEMHSGAAQSKGLLTHNEGIKQKRKL